LHDSTLLPRRPLLPQFAPLVLPNIFFVSIASHLRGTVLSSSLEPILRCSRPHTYAPCICSGSLFFFCHHSIHIYPRSVAISRYPPSIATRTSAFWGHQEGSWMTRKSSRIIKTYIETTAFCRWSQITDLQALASKLVTAASKQPH
jgi:hypothetical protein